MKPILFNTEMVRAILYGRKTVTRRCVKYKYSNTEMQMRTDKYGTSLIEIQKDVEGETFGKNEDGTTWRKLLAYIEKVPPFKVNDILYVRETWRLAYTLDDNDQAIEGTERYIYAASPEDMPNFTHWVDTNGEYRDFVPWRPSIHMPKEAARIFLKVTGVRVERLQEMRSQDALCEGITVHHDDLPHMGVISQFSRLWDTTIKKDQLQYYGWNANPYVWVIEFEVIDKAEAMAAGMVVLKEGE